jgi:hypothetical protein
MIKRSVEKVITEKEYDDIDQNRIININLRSRTSLFGIVLFTRTYNEKLDIVEGGEYKSKEKKGIGFNKVY